MEDALLLEGAAVSPSSQPCISTPIAAMLSVSRSNSAADLSTLSWVNTLFSWLWPKANIALTDFVHKDLTARLREKLPSAFREVKFSKFTLGQEPPEFGPIEVVRHSDTHVEINVDLKYHGDVDVQLDVGAGGITVGVRHLSFSGLVTIVLCPLLKLQPIIGAARVFFPASPKLSFQFTGLAALAHYPQLEQMIRRTVDDWLRTRVVLPKQGLWIFSDDEEIVDPVDAQGLSPLGVLRVRVVAGRHLAGVNWRMNDVENFDSDPYCELSLGDRTTRTSTVVGTTSPVWPMDEPSAYFAVHHRQQVLELSAHGQDRGGMFVPGNFVGFLGSASFSVAEALKKWPRPDKTKGIRKATVVLDTTQVSREMLHIKDPILRGVPSDLDVEAEWFDLVAKTSAENHVDQVASAARRPQALLLLEFRKGSGFPRETVEVKSGLRWRVSCGDATKPLITKRGEVCDLEEAAFPDVELHSRLHIVVDRLAERGHGINDIARIIGEDSSGKVSEYLNCKAEWEAAQSDVDDRQQQEDFRVSIEWNDVISVMVHNVHVENIVLHLLDGDERVIGSAGPLLVADMLPHAGLEITQIPLNVTPPVGVGALAAWFRPSSSAAPDYSKFEGANLDISAKLRFLQSSKGLPHRGQRPCAA